MCNTRLSPMAGGRGGSAATPQVRWPLQFIRALPVKPLEPKKEQTDWPAPFFID